MKSTNRIWVVVTDGVGARFLAPNSEVNGFIPAGPKTLRSPAAQAKTRQLKSDRPGRSFASSRSGVRHSIEPKHDYHKLAKHDFCEVVADALAAGRNRRAFEDLVLIAPRRSLGELRALLPAKIKACLREEIAKDLTKSSPDALWTRLAPVIGRLYRAAALSD